MKRKITRQSLDELRKSLTILPLCEQEYYVGGGSGTKEAPYTDVEYYRMLDSGTWTGGYVLFPDDVEVFERDYSGNWGLLPPGVRYAFGEVVVTAKRRNKHHREDDDYYQGVSGAISNTEDEVPSGVYISGENDGSHTEPPTLEGGTFPSPGANRQNTTNREASLTWDIDRAIAKLKQDAHTKSTKYCARAVMNAIEAGIDSKPRGLLRAPSAYLMNDTNGYLEKLGFIEVSPENYVPQKGDVIVIEPIEGHKHGHTAMFDGKIWISDFIQRDQYGGAAYRTNSKVIYTYHRHKSQQQ